MASTAVCVSALLRRRPTWHTRLLAPNATSTGGDFAGLAVAALSAAAPSPTLPSSPVVLHEEKPLLLASANTTTT
eukprot:11216650-Lingulodinium_polyedra.AAC.1